ncbi:MAG: hypothetical protein O9272_05325 [Brevundimonas sp.]|nr:hypothetical protein [Brevundimonas sp.]
MAKKARAHEAPYPVGYGKPPKEHQFPKGHSGFKGRKHKKSAGEDLPAGLNAFDRAVLRAAEGPAERAFEGGDEETGIEGLVNRMLGSALDGDMRATRLFRESYAAADAERRRLTPKDENGGMPPELVREITEFLLFKRRSRGEDGSQSGEGVDQSDEGTAVQDRTDLDREAASAAAGSEARLSEPAAIEPPDYPPVEPCDEEPAPLEPQMPEEDAAGGPAEVPASDPAIPDGGGAADPPAPPRPARQPRMGEPLIQSTRPLTADGYGLGGETRRPPRRGTFT